MWGAHCREKLDPQGVGRQRAQGPKLHNPGGERPTAAIDVYQTAEEKHMSEGKETKVEEQKVEEQKPQAAASAEVSEKVKAVLAALPAEKKALACTVLVLPVQRQEEYAAGGAVATKIWTVLQIDQGTVNKGKLLTNQGELKKVGEIDFPGGEVVFKFYRYPQDVEQNKVDRTQSVVGAWAALRLLHTPNAKRVTEDGTKWHVELVVKDSEARSRSLWLELVFPKPVPKLEEWP